MSLAGGASKGCRGVTLIEMMIVTLLLSLIAGVSFPAVSAGLETIRLSSASDSVASFLNGALNRAERRREVVEVAISPKENMLWMRSTQPGFERKLEMPDGVSIQGEPRRFLFLPGGTPPGVSIEMVNRKGARRAVRIDPMTGTPRIERTPST